VRLPHLKLRHIHFTQTASDLYGDKPVDILLPI
jgi:hypothetical protein